ncbi:aminotransferase class I/II-fold pyridoxal phosphate-dependent enzyme [Candidatus Saccharibacteria bacterium]|nr:aminotransferase class I/II-fold pyridoxal phosphate-dependent enzyme [Candidatus Saccharibacteria bacterium]
MSGDEQQYIQDAFDTNWIAPLGPNVEAFEQEFCEIVGSKHALALSSGTAALHLAMILADVGSGDEVIVSSLTFSASVNPIVYQGANPVFIDSERISWNIDPDLLEETLSRKSKNNRLPKAVVPVHLYGQSADMDSIMTVCNLYGVPVIEDAAEALGASYKGRTPGTFGKSGIFSFNGNKIITTSGGGMLVSDDEAYIAHARKLSTQARDSAPHYQHSEIGYNYRLSNILAGVGRGQLMVLEERVKARRRNFAYYQEHLSDLLGISFMPEAPWGRHTRWLTVITVEPSQFGVDRETIRLALESQEIESRPLWKPMHLQPVFADCEMVGGSVAEELFDHGLCLPSGSTMTESDLRRVVDVIVKCSV